MQFLTDIGISQKTIELIEDQCVDLELENFELFKRDLTSSIELLRSVGVKSNIIEDILCKDFRVLLSGEKYIKKALDNTGDINTYVNKLNSDFMYYEYLYNDK